MKPQYLLWQLSLSGILCTTSLFVNAGAIKSFTIINADSDKDIVTVTTAGKVDLTLTPRINLRADVDNAGSVVFSNGKIESSAPFSYQGDSQGNYFPWSPAAGNYTITATSFSGANGTGTKESTLTLTLTVSAGTKPSASPTKTPTSTPTNAGTIKSFTIVNADSDKDLVTVTTQGKVDLTLTPRINLRANVENAGSVVFSNGKIESSAPLSYQGDAQGNYFPWSPAPGIYTITATSFSGANGTGTKNGTLTLTLTVNSGNQPPASPTQKPASPTQKPMATPSKTPTSANACKAKPIAFTNVGLGLPSFPHKLPTNGRVRTMILFADFSDVPATKTPAELFSTLAPAANFFGTISYEKMNWELPYHPAWLRLGNPSAFYGQLMETGGEGHRQFIQEAVDLADSRVDFSTVDSVVVIVPPEVQALKNGPALGFNSGTGYTADGKIFSNGVTSGADLAYWGYRWLNHEIGHNMGLPDLYSYKSGPVFDIYRFVGNFGLMANIHGLAPEFFAFERWQLGWLNDSQIICQSQGEQIVTLTPIEKQGGIKAVMIPVSKSKVVVVESRRAIGYDQKLVKAGALVYMVDTSIYTGAGPIVVYPQSPGDPDLNQSPRAIGESVTVDKVTITVLDAGDFGDQVQVTVAP